MQSSWRRPKLGISVNEKNYFLLSKNHHFLHGKYWGHPSSWDTTVLKPKHINETAFHLLIIFYCKDLNFFTFTNFANCSTSNLIMLCISGNTGQPICTVDSNNESTSAAVFQKTTQRCHVYKYVGIFADAYTRCRNKFRQMRWQIQMQKFAVMRLRMQNSTKVCAAKLTYRDTCTFRSWLYRSSSRLFVVAFVVVVVVVVGQNLPTIRTS